MIGINPTAAIKAPVRGLTQEGPVLLFNGVPVDAMFAYPLRLLPALLGRNARSIRREVARGRLKLGPSKLVSRQEFQRYLALEKLQPGRPRKIAG